MNLTFYEIFNLDYIKILCYVFNDARTQIFSRILVTKTTTEEFNNATTDNNGMYGEINDPSTVLKDEKKTFI